jgi:undecaprenyl-diphosphatase
MSRVKVTTIDEAITRLIAKLPKSSRPFFMVMSRVGHPITICCIAGVIVAIGLLQPTPITMLSGAFIWVAILISTVLKNTTKRSRPLTDYVAGMHIRSYSFPSGHTTGSTITFGLLAYYALHLLALPLGYFVLALASFLILSIGVSRVYLGAHFPTDVIGGWMLGTTMLAIVIFVIRPLA